MYLFICACAVYQIFNELSLMNNATCSYLLYIYIYSFAKLCNSLEEYIALLYFAPFQLFPLLHFSLYT